MRETSVFTTHGIATVDGGDTLRWSITHTHTFGPLTRSHSVFVRVIITCAREITCRLCEARPTVHGNYVKIYAWVLLLPIFQPLRPADLCPSSPPFTFFHPEPLCPRSFADIFRLSLCTHTHVSNVPPRPFPVCFPDRGGSAPSTGVPSRIRRPRGPCRLASPVTYHRPVVRTFCSSHEPIVDVLLLFICPRSVHAVFKRRSYKYRFPLDDIAPRFPFEVDWVLASSIFSVRISPPTAFSRSK